MMYELELEIYCKMMLIIAESGLQLIYVDVGKCIGAVVFGWV